MQLSPGKGLINMQKIMCRKYGKFSHGDLPYFIRFLYFTHFISAMQHIFRFRPSLFFVCLVLLAHGISMSAQTFFYANLTGAQEVPAVSTPALGTAWAVLSQDRTRLTYQITYARLQGTYTVSHIHEGAPTTNGPVRHGFTFGANNTQRGTWTSIPSTQADILLAGNMYFNVHSTIAPGGEIRGQLIPVTTAGITPYVMDITADQVPLAITSGRGTGFLLQNATLATYSMTVAGMPVAITVSHFHRGTRGRNGGVAQGFTFTDSTLNGTWVMAQADLDTLRANGVYANIHTARNPAGEIRGQVDPIASVLTSVRPFTADILGDLRVYPNPADYRSTLQMNFRQPTVVTVEIINALGQTVMAVLQQARVYGTTDIPLDLQGLAPGLYFARIRSTDMMQSVPLVVQR